MHNNSCTHSNAMQLTVYRDPSRAEPASPRACHDNTPPCLLWIYPRIWRRSQTGQEARSPPPARCRNHTAAGWSLDTADTIRPRNTDQPLYSWALPLDPPDLLLYSPEIGLQTPRPSLRSFLSTWIKCLTYCSSLKVWKTPLLNVHCAL